MALNSCFERWTGRERRTRLGTRTTVTAVTRALKAEYTMELAQDLKAIHGLDAETELANILSGEILAEINREVIRSIYVSAVPGAQVNTTTAGIFDLDTD